MALLHRYRVGLGNLWLLAVIINALLAFDRNVVAADAQSRKLVEQP
jgi:hypothetical protein